MGKSEQEVVKQVESKPYDCTRGLPLAVCGPNLLLQLNTKTIADLMIWLDLTPAASSFFSSSPRVNHLVERVLVLHGAGPAGSISVVVVLRCATRGLQQAFRAVAPAL